MDFVNTYFVNVLKEHYFDFNYKADRRQYWLYVLCVFILSFVVSFVLGLISASLASIVSMLISLGLLLPGLGITIARLKDAGKPWQWIFIALVPVIGLILIYFLVQPSVSESK